MKLSKREWLYFTKIFEYLLAGKKIDFKDNKFTIYGSETIDLDEAKKQEREILDQFVIKDGKKKFNEVLEFLKIK